MECAGQIMAFPHPPMKSRGDGAQKQEEGGNSRGGQGHLWSACQSSVGGGSSIILRGENKRIGP